MKLRNKKTGEIVEPSGITCINGRTFVRFNDGEGTFKFEAHSLAELNEEWKDYEEAKGYWYITSLGEIVYRGFSLRKWNSGDDCRLEIGNYFEAREEAEQVVEKLKAWKRLRDKGFKFILDGETEMPMFVYSGANGEKCITSATESKQYREDIKLLFGGEE